MRPVPFGGAVYGLSGAPAVPREWLGGSPFSDYKVPSAVLGGAVGTSSAVAAITALRGSEAAMSVGAARCAECAWVEVDVHATSIARTATPGVGYRPLSRRGKLRTCAPAGCG
jgi:hypothetical protein